MEIKRWGNMASNHLESYGMNDLATQNLIYRASKWPWKWFSIFNKAASICQREIENATAQKQQDLEKFNVLKSEHHILKLECSELHVQKVRDAETIQFLRMESQRLNADLESARNQRLQGLEREKMLEVDLKVMREERTDLIKKHDQMKDGVHTIFEFIRRKNLTDHRGVEIPKIPRFPNMFGK